METTYIGISLVERRPHLRTCFWLSNLIIIYVESGFSVASSLHVVLINFVVFVLLQEWDVEIFA